MIDHGRVTKLINTNLELTQDMYFLQKKVKNIQNEIKQNNITIYHTCQHQWKHSDYSTIYEREYVCTTCHLVKNMFPPLEKLNDK